MKYLVLIQARCGSSRLPNKVMKKISGKTDLEWVLERVKRSKKIDEVMVITSIEKNNLPLIKLCTELNTRVFVGSEDDVLDRYYQAARLLNPEYVIRITADCPLFDWNYLDLAIEQLEADTDYMSELTESFPDGLDIEIMKFSVLEEAWQNAKMASEREHVTLYIRNHADKYKLQNFECPISGIGDKRWTLDEPADLKLIEKIYEYFINQGKENFVTEPEKDGAFICKNSWGADFGQNGFFYISYEDPNIGVYGVSYTGVEDADNYDRIYQTDLLGWTGSIGYNEPMAWFSSVYQTDSKNTLRAAGFYATDAETYYDIYLVRDFEGIEDMDRRVFLQSGYIKDKGYYTIPLENPQPLEADQRFAVIVQIYTRDSMHPIAIEYVSNELTVEADISDGESYMSYNGSLWSHMEEASACNACLKAYTDLTPDQ